MTFTRTTAEQETTEKDAYYFIFSNNHILVKKESENLVSIPVLKSDPQASLFNSLRFLGTHDNMPCYCGKLLNDNPPEHFERINLGLLHEKISRNFRRMAWHARQIHDWNDNFKFCGKCGRETEEKSDEHARVCPVCGLIGYPRISPAIITAVVKEDKILLARGVNFPDKKMFSVLAGFVEPGESLEECVKREVFEETGIAVENVKYFASQPWPFPDSLMIGFTAEYKSGDILVDKNELEEASWFSADRLPSTPKPYSISGKLIDWFVKNHG